MANFTPDFKPYTGQGKFRYWVQRVLPTIYDDSLSYMELLNKVVYALNLVIEDMDAVEDNVAALLNSFNKLQEYVNEYFDNLDVQDEIDAKIDAMVEDGTFTEILEPLISNYEIQLQGLNDEFIVLKSRVDNLTETITPGGTTGDAELADIRVAFNGETYDTAGNSVRGQINSLVNTFKYNLMDVLSLAAMPEERTQSGVTYTPNEDGSITVTGTSTASSFVTYYLGTTLPKWLEAGKTYLLKHNSNTIYFEIMVLEGGQTYRTISGLCYEDKIITMPDVIPAGDFYVRVGVWGSGKATNQTIHPVLLTDTEVMHIKKEETETNCNNAPDNTIIFNSYVAGTGGNISDFPINGAGWLQTITYSDRLKFQIAYPYNTSEFKDVLYRTKQINTWGEWMPLNNSILIKKDLLNISCDNAPDNSIIFNSYEAGGGNISDFPINGAGWLQTITYSDRLKFQMAYPYNTNEFNTVYYRTKQLNAWGEWISLGMGGTVTIIQEVSRDTYQNTYNINTTPTITTDTNGWLQAIDSNTQSETGKMDMTGAIMSMLTNTGYCHLSPGIFYVTGNIDIPAGATLEGCGKQTIIRLLQSVSSGYIAKINNNATIKNITFSGGYNDGDISDGNIGGRIGVAFTANENAKLCQITNCWFENLDSGIYGNNTGGGLEQGIEVTNCNFRYCKAGINLDSKVEYSKFTSCVTFRCYYGCINNGGNNVFTACTFHGVIGMLLDNSSDTKPNSGHGSVIGCTFNHIDNINHPTELGGGIGIKILNIPYGFIFEGCQLWYGEIYVENSRGIQFANCLLGGGTPTIEVINYPAFFNGCIFQTQPNITQNTNTKFNNCYTFAAQPVEP